jgi:TrmH family RNA methyltransferase
MAIITSAANQRLKQLRQALRAAHVDPQGSLPIEGAKLIQEAINSRLLIEEIFVAQSRRQEPMVERLLAQVKSPSTEVVEVADRAFPSISDVESPQGLLALARLPKFELNELLKDDPLLLVGFELQDPGNLGTLLRSAEAFGGRAVLLTRKSVSPLNAKVVRASAGSIFRIPCLSRLDIPLLMGALTQHGFRLLATTPRASVDFRKATYSGKVALLVGNEARGLDSEILHRVHTRIRIPMDGRVESLNASIATSIILCEAARQRALSSGDCRLLTELA